MVITFQQPLQQSPNDTRALLRIKTKQAWLRWAGVFCNHVALFWCWSISTLGAFHPSMTKTRTATHVIPAWVPSTSNHKNANSPSTTFMGRPNAHLFYDQVAMNPVTLLLSLPSSLMSSESIVVVPATSSEEGSIIDTSSLAYGVISSLRSSSIWNKLLPPLWKGPRSRGVDERVQWNMTDKDWNILDGIDGIDAAGTCCRKAATIIVDKINKAWENQGSEKIVRLNTVEENQMISNVANSMMIFSRFCFDHKDNLDITLDLDRLTFSARIVTSRGSAGTKCPQWHIDHVPVRWIQSLCGRGVQWIANSGRSTNSDSHTDVIRWHRMNALGIDNHSDDTSTTEPTSSCCEDHDHRDDNDVNNSSIMITSSVRDRNRLLINSERAVIQEAREGQAVLLLGNQWRPPNPSIGQTFFPAVHKSPDGLRPWEPRILLTMDVHV